MNERADNRTMEERLVDHAREYAVAINPVEFRDMARRLGCRVEYLDGASPPPGPATMMLCCGATTLTVIADEAVSIGSFQPTAKQAS